MNNPGVIFFGNERLASGVTTTAPLFRWLLDSEYQIKALVLSQGEQRGRNKRDAEVEELAEQYHIPVLKPDTMKEIEPFIQNSGALVGVLAAFGKIVPQSTIDSFEHGIINLHPSLLPQGRGSTPIETAILEGYRQTGVSLMSLVAKMDAGPVYGFSELTLSGQETKQELYEQLSELAVALLSELLPRIIDGSADAARQDEDSATYTGQLNKSLSDLNFNKPAVRLEREVRAFAGWPKSRAMLAGKEVVVTAAANVESQQGKPGDVFVHEDCPAIQTIDGALLIKSLVPAGKQEMSGQAFLRGNPLQ